MPRLSHLLDAKRAPLDQALVNFLMAQADLNGMLTALRMGRDGYTTNDRATRDRIAKVVGRAHDARHALDKAGYGTLDVHAIGGRALCTNDHDDMLDACIARLERNHYGIEPSSTAPAHPADIARGASILHDTAEPVAAEIGEAA